MKKYKATVTVVFSGTVDINAANKAEAKSLLKGCFGICNPSVSTTLNTEIIPNWCVNLHPDSEQISNIKLR